MSCCSARQMNRPFAIPLSARSLYGLITVVVVSAAACSGDPHAAMLKFEKSGDAFANAGKLPETIIEYRNAESWTLLPKPIFELDSHRP